jgi:hypothetical protein
MLYYLNFLYYYLKTKLFKIQKNENENKLLKLPEDMIQHISSFLDQKTYIQFIKSCKEINQYKLNFLSCIIIDEKKSRFILKNYLLFLKGLGYYEKKNFIETLHIKNSDSLWIYKLNQIPSIHTLILERCVFSSIYQYENFNLKLIIKKEIKCIDNIDSNYLFYEDNLPILPLLI